MRKTILLALVGVLVAGAFTGCSKPDVNDTLGKGQVLTVTDSRGKEIEISYPAQRIVCLLNSGLNDLYMLGAKDQVVGIDKWTYDTKEVYELTSKIDDRVKGKTLPAVDNNVEKIIELNPDVVIIWDGYKDNINALEKKGIKVVSIQVNNFDDVFWKLNLLGKIAGKEERAAEIEKYARNQISEISSNVSDADAVNAIFVWGPSKLDIAGNKSTGNSILELAGIKNSASAINEEHFIANMEQVLEWNPEAVIMWNAENMDPADFYDDEQWDKTSAVKNRKVFELPHPFYCDLWTVKYIYSVRVAAKQLHPGILRSEDLTGYREDMLEFLYGVDF